MSMPPLDIHKSNEIEIVVAFASFGKTCIFLHLVTIVGSMFLSQVVNGMETKHKDIDVNLTFVTKCSNKWKKPCNFYIYTTPSFQPIALFVRI
jgi:hypothetical protein